MRHKARARSMLFVFGLTVLARVVYFIVLSPSYAVGPREPTS